MCEERQCLVFGSNYFGRVANYVDNHIVTAGYLRRFANDGGLIQPVRPRDPSNRPIPLRRPETVGYRSRFFSDPELAEQAEQTLSQWEGRGLQALARIDRTWPVDTDAKYRDRLDIACLVAIHMVRNPAFRSYVARLQSENIELQTPELNGSNESDEDFLRLVTSERYWVGYMLGAVPKMASLIASTHWTMAEFPDRLLATSDQPVTAVPLLIRGIPTGVAPQPESGFMLTEEYRFPIDPRRALIFTWANRPDTPKPVRASYDIAADLNRAVIAQLDNEWFHHPSRRPTCLPLTGIPTSECRPIGRLLVPGYGPTQALRSKRREHAEECLSRMIRDQVVDGFHVARVVRAAA